MNRKAGMVLISLLVQSCVVYTPSVAKKGSDSASCEVITRKLELKPTVFGGHIQCDSIECLTVPLAAATASFIVSGSIVVVNNTLHWAEYKGRCGFDQADEDGALKDNVTSPVVNGG